MRTFAAGLMVAAGALLGGAALAGDTPAPEDAHLYIGWPNDGEVISSCSFRVWFGLRDMGVAPAQVDKAPPFMPPVPGGG